MKDKRQRFCVRCGKSENAEDHTDFYSQGAYHCAGCAEDYTGLEVEETPLDEKIRVLDFSHD